MLTQLFRGRVLCLVLVGVLVVLVVSGLGLFKLLQVFGLGA